MVLNSNKVPENRGNDFENKRGSKAYSAKPPLLRFFVWSSNLNFDLY